MNEVPHLPEKQNLGDLVREAMSVSADDGAARGRSRTTKRTLSSKAPRKKGATSIKNRKPTTATGARARLNSHGSDEGHSRVWIGTTKATARTVISIMRNEILSTTERALYEFYPALGRAIKACISKLTDEESKVTMSVEDVASVVAELATIETACGKRMIFGQVPISDVSAAWRSLLV
jgi:hypothetical protein